MMGSSLKALMTLATSKGYFLAAVNLDDAFFVRGDVVMPKLDFESWASKIIKSRAKLIQKHQK